MVIVVSASTVPVIYTSDTAYLGMLRIRALCLGPHTPTEGQFIVVKLSSQLALLKESQSHQHRKHIIQLGVCFKSYGPGRLASFVGRVCRLEHGIP